MLIWCIVYMRFSKEDAQFAKVYHGESRVKTLYLNVFISTDEPYEEFPRDKQ